MHCFGFSIFCPEVLSKNLGRGPARTTMQSEHIGTCVRPLGMVGLPHVFWDLNGSLESMMAKPIVATHDGIDIPTEKWNNRKSRYEIQIQIPDPEIQIGKSNWGISQLLLPCKE